MTMRRRAIVNAARDRQCGARSSDGKSEFR
jgi:hypothetical protein